MKRRQFIRTAAAFAAASTLPLHGTETRRIKIGFLGGSHSHGPEKFKTALELQEFDVIGICEDLDTVRETFLKLGAKALSRDELLTQAEVVVIESAVRDHARDARLALGAGKHIHLEKPPATTMRDMEEIIRLACEKQRLMQLGYMWRFNPGINAAIEAAQNGWLGEVYLVRATINTLLAAKQRLEVAEFPGGTMFELGGHLIDPVVRLLGKPSRVTPHLQRRGGDSLADNCIAVFEFAKAQAIVTSATLQPNAGANRCFEILGTKGIAHVQPIEQPLLHLDLTNAAGPYQKGRQEVEQPLYRRYKDELKALAEAVRGNKPLAVTLETELAVQETLLRACEMF